MKNRARDQEDEVKESSDEESEPTSSNGTSNAFSGDDLLIASEED